MEVPTNNFLIYLCCLVSVNILKVLKNIYSSSVEFELEKPNYTVNTLNFLSFNYSANNFKIIINNFQHSHFIIIIMNKS